jgi:NAD(P)-dependent dehydrogenase (short-subunit alcohol dehydrogenase family)
MSIERSLREMMSLDGRVAVITGGAGHIGRAIAGGLAELGATIALVDIAAAPGKEAAAHLAKSWPVKAEMFDCDFEQGEAVKDLPRRVREAFGGIDIIVNCAAFVGTSGLQGWAAPFEQQSDVTWRRALEVNLTAPFVLVQAAAEDLARSGHGSVINIASIYGLAGPDWRLYEGTTLGNPAAYAASKGGLIQMTRWLATTMAPKVRVNAVAPGGVFRATPEPFLSRYVARTPLARMAREDDMKGAVAYLASDLSAYVTGQCIAVDGGWTAW